MCVTYANGTGTAAYQWFSNSTNSTTGGTPIGSATLSCYTPPSLTAVTTYYYAVISLTGGGCSSITSNTAEVIISAGTSLSTQPTPTQTICVGGTIPAPLSVSYAGGAGTPSYQWYSFPSNTAIVGATSTTYSPPAFNSAGTNSYYVTVTLPGAGCGAQTSNTANIVVVADPAATISSNSSYCQNAGNVNALAVVVTGGNGTPFYQWYSNTANSNTGGSMITGANAISYSPPVATTGTTYYYCMITQSGTNCAVNSPAAQIIVTPAPTFTTQPTATQSVCIGGATTLLSVAYSNGTGTATYQWYANSSNSYSGGTAIPLQTNASFTPPSVASSTIYYYCIVSFSASGGCSMINSNIAEVIVVPDPTISAQPLTTQTICVGGTIPAALNIAYTGGVGTPTYQWFAGTPSSSISGATASSYTPPVYSGVGTFNYSATINLSGSGCDALTSSNGTVIVVADPTATISTGASYCQNAGSVVSLSVVVSNGQGTPSYQWYSNTANSNTGGSMITGANAISYSPPVTTTGTTYYYCMITQSGTNCAVNSPSAQIIVTPAPTFTTQPTATQSVCIGGATTQLNVAYSNGTGAATYQWYSNTSNTYAGGTAIATATGTNYTPPSLTSGTTYYYCIISFSSSGGCSMISSDISTVIVVPDPTVSTQPFSAQTICVGGTIPAALNVAYSGGVGTPNFQWFSIPSSSISGATNSTYTPPTFITTGTYNYYATISLTGSGCDVLTSTNATITVVADPIVSAQPTVTQSVCQNTATSQISVSVTGGNGSASYQWFSNTSNSNAGGTTIVGATLNTYTPPSNVVGTQYYYCVINQSGANCGVTSNPAAVVVNLAPAISVQPLGTQQLCLNAITSNLQVTYSNGTGLPTYQWYLNTTNSAVGGTQINAATNNIFTPPSNVAGTYYYYCVISFLSGGGCPSITSNVSQVIIHPYPIVTITGGETICLLESADINFAFTPSSGLYDITYTANGQSVTLDNYNGANPVYTVTPSQTTTYVVTNIAYDQVPQCAIQPNTSIVVIVNPLPALNNSNYTFCSDVATTSLQYIPDANTYTYNWLPNSSVNYPGQNNGPTVINVSLPNPIGNASTNFYYVTNLINNATGCHALDSILVTINPNPFGTFTLPTTGCINSPIALSNGDATIGSYEWSIDGTLYSLLANPTPPVFTVLGDHTIEMVAINQYGCTDTLNSVIQIYDLPVANFTTDLDYGCAPVDVNFTNLSSGLYVTSYDWTFAPDTVSWNYQYSSTNLVDPPSVTYLQGDVTTIYTATLAVTNACGTVTAQHDITVLPTPVAEFTLATHTICSGSSLVLNNISVGEPLTYYWTYGNTISYNPNLLSMYFPSDSVTHVYPLTLTLTNACGTDTYIDSVTVLPDLINGGFITTADAGCSPLTVTLTNTTFNTSLSSTWHLDDPLNTIVSNQNSVQFTYYATNNITQNYNPYLVVTDGCASDTIVANLNVFANPLPIISASQSNLCAGTTINFSGAITGGDTGFGYNWDFGGLGTSNSSTTSFTFPAGSPSGLAIPITLTATSPTFSGTNCSNTTTTIIHVYNNPDASQIAFNTTEGCSDLGVTVSNLPSATNQINWGDGTTNFNNSHTYVNNGSGLVSYPVTINSTLNYGTIPALTCSTISNQLVNVYPIPLPQIFATGTNVCEGDNIDFIASTANNQNTGITYLWNFGALGTSASLSPSITFDSGNSTGLQTPIQLTAFQNTSGTICSATVNEFVFVYDTPDLTAALYSDVNDCSPLLVSITNLPTSTYTYNWGDGITTSNPNHLYLNQGTTPLTYNITVNATSFYTTLPLLSCNAIANQIVQVNPQPFAAFTLSPNESCLYVPVNTTLQNTSLNAIAPYVWNYDGIAHTTNALNYIGTFNTAGAHPVELIVSNQFGCTDSVSHDFIIHELPTVTLNAIDDDLCNGTTAEFDIDGTGISTSSWDFGDGTTLNLLNPTSLIHYYSQPGVYSVTAIVTNIYGCTDTLSFPNEVIVHPSPTASFTTSSTTADIVYPYFEFYDNSAGAINYYWNFGDSNWSNEINPTHSYNSEGDYLVELTVTNEYNCFDIATEVVHVEGIVMYVPNAFTPLDYNGVNDVFKPSFSSTEGIEFYEFSIYDRWGIKIFSTNDFNEPWIGNSQEHAPGDDNYYAQNDIYTYQVVYRKKARSEDPQPDRIVTGHVTIIR
jgi:PKD repeat protein